MIGNRAVAVVLEIIDPIACISANGADVVPHGTGGAGRIGLDIAGAVIHAESHVRLALSCRADVRFGPELVSTSGALPGRHSNMLSNKEKQSKNTSTQALFHQFPCKNQLIKGCDC